MLNRQNDDKCADHLEALHAVLDVPLHHGLELGGFQGGGARGLALQPLVPGHHIIPEKHTEDVGNAAVVRYTSLQIEDHRFRQCLDQTRVSRWQEHGKGSDMKNTFGVFCTLGAVSLTQELAICSSSNIRH